MIYSPDGSARGIPGDIEIENTLIYGIGSLNIQKQYNQKEKTKPTNKYELSEAQVNA